MTIHVNSDAAASIDQAASQAQDQAHTMFADATTRSKVSMEKGMAFLGEMNDFAKGNVEAIVESSRVAAKGMEDMIRQAADKARTNVEQANETVRKFAAVRSPTEFFQLNTEVARSAMDQAAQESARFAETYLKLAGAVAQPIQNRFALAAEKVKAVAA